MKEDILNPLFNREKALELEEAKDIKHLSMIHKFAHAKTLEEQVMDYRKEAIALRVRTSEDEMKVKAIGYCDYNLTTQSEGFEILYSEKLGVEGMVEHLAQIVKYCHNEKKNLICFDKKDSINILKLLLQYNNHLDDEQFKEACERFSKNVAGVYSHGEWEVDPVVSCRIRFKESDFGIMRVAGDTYQFFYHSKRMREEQKAPIKVWFFHVSKFYKKNTIEEMSMENGIGVKQFSEKRLGERIDWYRFNADFDKTVEADHLNNHKPYARRVVGELAQECYALKFLYNKIRDKFESVFGVYNRLFISPGSMTTVAMAKAMSFSENESLNYYNQMKDWRKNGVSDEDICFIGNMAIDAYSAGMIDLYTMGSVDDLCMVDITSAYPSVMRSLLDLRGSKIRKGGACKFEDVPKPNGNNYVFMTAEVFVKKGFTHSLAIKAPLIDQTLDGLFQGDEDESLKDFARKRDNFRPEGAFIVTGLWEEFYPVYEDDPEFGIEEVLEWVEIETTGQLSPLAKVIDDLFQKREQAIADKDEFAEYLTKLIINSIYGKLFECLRQYRQNEDGKIEFDGHRTGGYFNPVLAAITTSFTRVRITEAMREIQKRRGKILVVMTDAIYWKGKPTDLPQEFDSILGMGSRYGLEKNGWTEKKTLGYFSKPKQYSDGIFLKPGLYEYYDRDKDEYEVKTMSFNVQRTPAERRKPYFFNRMQWFMLRENRTYNTQLSECILMRRNEIIGPKEVSEGRRNKFQLGTIDNKEIKLAFDDIYPKRTLRNPLDCTLENLVTGEIDTHATSANAVREIAWAHAGLLDGRLLEYRPLYQGNPINEESEKSRLETIHKYDDKIGTLAKQLGIPKASSNPKKVTGKKLGVEKMRLMLVEMGIEPLV